MEDPTFKYQFRIILIGDASVGKSALLRYFMDGSFAEISDATVGVDFYAQLLKTSDGTSIKLQLWDTAGQEQFRSITKSYYRNSVGAFLVYDLCDRASFDNIPNWMNEVKRQIQPHDAVFILVGCKYDLILSGKKRRVVSYEEASEFAEENFLEFFETSSKSGLHIKEAFISITQRIYDKILRGEFALEDGWDGIRKGYFVPEPQQRLRYLQSDAMPNKCC